MHDDCRLQHQEAFFVQANKVEHPKQLHMSWVLQTYFLQNTINHKKMNVRCEAMPLLTEAAIILSELTSRWMNGMAANADPI